MTKKENGLSLLEVVICTIFFSVISLSIYNHYNRSAELHYMDNVSVVMCRYADALGQYLQAKNTVSPGVVQLKTLISDGYLLDAPNSDSDDLGGWYRIVMYVDRQKNGLIALYGDEHNSLTVDSIKQFLGMRGASVSANKIISAGGYYSLPITDFTGFETVNLRGIMLIPFIHSSGQNCDRGGYVF